MQKKLNKLAVQVKRHQQILSRPAASTNCRSDESQNNSQASVDGSVCVVQEVELINITVILCKCTKIGWSTLNLQNDVTVRGRQINKLKLATALLQPTPVAMALKLMMCLFTKEELVNGTPSGTTTSKYERRQRTVKKLDPVVMGYIEGTGC